MSHTKVTLKTGSGKVDEISELIQQITDIKPQYYWFEPDIAACIGKTLPLETLKQYHPDNWQKEPFRELMLFGNTAGMTLLKQDNGKYRYFYWQEDDTGNTSNNLNCIKQTRDAYLRDFSQFDLDEENEEKKKYSELSKKLKITEYLHQNQRIAWTIADTEKPVEEEES